MVLWTEESVEHERPWCRGSLAASEYILRGG